MIMHYQQNTVWRKEINRALKAYSQDMESLREELLMQDDASHENRPSRKLLYNVEKKIQDTKHLIRRCRNEHVWMPALVQQPGE